MIATLHHEIPKFDFEKPRAADFVPWALKKIAGTVDLPFFLKHASLRDVFL